LILPHLATDTAALSGDNRHSHVIHGQALLSAYIREPNGTMEATEVKLGDRPV